MTESATQREQKRTSLISSLKNRAYRDSYVASHINSGIPFQIRAIRKSRDLTQKALAKLSGMTQNRISTLENPDGAEPNIRTLRTIAAAFDCALIVRFVPFSELVDWTTSLGVGSLDVPSFDNDRRLYEETKNDNLFRIADFSSFVVKHLQIDPLAHKVYAVSASGETTSGAALHGMPQVTLPSGEMLFAWNEQSQSMLASKYASKHESVRMNPFDA